MFYLSQQTSIRWKFAYKILNTPKRKSKNIWPTVSPVCRPDLLPSSLCCALWARSPMSGFTLQAWGKVTESSLWWPDEHKNGDYPGKRKHQRKVKLALTQKYLTWRVAFFLKIYFTTIKSWKDLKTLWSNKKGILSKVGIKSFFPLENPAISFW